MGNSLATRAAFNPAAQAPKLTEFQRRSLADPFSLGGNTAAWEPPGGPEWVDQNRARIQAVKGELERGLMAPTPSHMQWCVRKLFALPSKDKTPLSEALMADNFLDACGHFPDDLWTWGTTELLKASTFRPSPAEMVKLLEPKYGERQRMAQRCTLMLDAPAPPKTQASSTNYAAIERLKRILEEQRVDPNVSDEDRLFNMANTERALALQERRLMADWAEKFFADRIVPDRDSLGHQAKVAVDRSTPTNRRVAELAAAKREGRPAPEYRDVAEAS